MSRIRRFTKRVFDDRVFGYNVTGKLRAGDTVSSFDSVAATAQKGEPEDLTVAVPASNSVTEGDKQLNFECEGGEIGHVYDVILRFTPGTETQLEVLVEVECV